MILPFTWGPRSLITTTALLPLLVLVTLAFVPSGRVLLAALFEFGSIRAPLTIFLPAKLWR